MKDQIDFLSSLGIPAARLDSSISADEARNVNEQLAAGSIKLLYVAPERFNNERFLSMIRRLRVSLFAVDEAHCISEWGHNFRPDYLKLVKTARDLGVERVLALTATATPAVVQDICSGFGIPQEAAIVTGFYRPNLKLLVTPASAGDRDSLLLRRLKSRSPGPTIVYVTLQRTAVAVADRLTAEALPARAYHAGLDPDIRTEIQDWWMTAADGIVVATIAFGMGIDRADVRYVYHYNLPKSLESYSQEIGRAGRDGQTSVVELLACPDDVPVLENFSYGDTPSKESLQALVSEVLKAGPALDVSLYDMSARLDMRQLVLRTALTYLELLGALSQGTPYYAGYEVKPLIAIPQMASQLPGEPGMFLTAIFNQARKGRIWYRVNPDEAAAALGHERRRVVRALEYAAEHRWADLKLGDARQTYTRLREIDDCPGLVAELLRRFDEREKSDLARIREVLELATYEGCLTNALVSHFGEVRPDPCGHCGYCVTGRAVRFPATAPRAPLPGPIMPADLAQIRAAHSEALAGPRQVARFLCGLSSPAISRARIGQHALFGALDAYPFSEVMAWVASLP
jgi:ATP-dependent DNA helicase RecQ